MTDRYDVTHLQKQIFFSQLKEFFELIVFYSVYCIIHLEMFIDFFFVLYKVLQTNSVQKQDKKNGESGYRSQYLPHAKRALYHLS